MRDSNFPLPISMRLRHQAQRLQPTCNAHNGGVNELLLKNLLELLFSLLVEGRCGFVQKEHGVFFEKHASETNLRQA